MVTVAINCSSIFSPSRQWQGSLTVQKGGNPITWDRKWSPGSCRRWTSHSTHLNGSSLWLLFPLIHVENPNYVSMILLLEQVLISASDNVWPRSIWETTSGKSPGKRALPSSLISLSSRCLLLRFCSFEVTSPTVSLSLRC